VRIVANRCWEAIERARITRLLLRKTRSLGLLAKAGTRLLSQDDPRALIESLFNEAGEIADLELCFHFLAPDDGDRLRLEVCRGVDEAGCRQVQEIELGQVLCGHVTARRCPIVRERVLHASDDASAWLRRMGVNAYACFPLLAGDGLVGTLSFGSRTREQFDEEDVTFLQALSDQVAIAYGRARAASSLRGSEERLRQAVAIAGLGTFDVDPATDTVIVNEPGRAIYGWAPGEPITFARIQRQFHPDDRAAVRRAVRHAFVPQGGHIFDIEHRIIRTDGSERWVRARGQVIFEHAAEPRAVRVIGTYLDVTARKEAEQRREASLAAERAAREHAERLGRLKDEFLATVSHELRTPLNAILGWSQLLGRREMPSEEARRAVETIRRNARAQAVLIDDLLDMNRIVSGKLRLEMHPMDLTVAVAGAIESIEPALRAKGVHLRENLPPHSATVLGDPARIQQVLWNLLSNAIKFTPAGGTIEVGLSTKSRHALIEISDTGMGITPGFLPYIFEPFRQQDASTTRRHGGVGLGLSIVKELVELHGGSVDAFSGGEGAGTRVVVSLPMPQDRVMAPDQSVLRDNPGS
jgi:PAS domain S-box-containing protein